MCQDCDDDRYDEYKDDLAMDRIWADGSYREPSDEPDDDPFSDLNIAHAAEYHRYLEHRERKHGGEECDCRPPWWRRAWWWLSGKRRSLRNMPFRVRAFVRQMRTIQVGPLELTVRYRPASHCGACRGDGWFYTKTGLKTAKPMPEGYDGVSLCGCGSAVTKLADARRVIRSAANEPPF